MTKREGGGIMKENIILLEENKNGKIVPLTPNIFDAVYSFYNVL